MGAEATAAEPQLRLIFQRLAAGDLGAAPLWFSARVLDGYRGREGWRVLRTNTVGRVKSPAGWSLDFGIAPGDELILVWAGDVAQRLPATERARWAEHLVGLPTSSPFLTMRLSGGAACIDDGDTRDWTG
jgi:hypothetical protein